MPQWSINSINESGAGRENERTEPWSFVGTWSSEICVTSSHSSEPCVWVTLGLSFFWECHQRCQQTRTMRAFSLPFALVRESLTFLHLLRLGWAENVPNQWAPFPFGLTTLFSWTEIYFFQVTFDSKQQNRTYIQKCLRKFLDPNIRSPLV